MHCCLLSQGTRCLGGIAMTPCSVATRAGTRPHSGERGAPVRGDHAHRPAERTASKLYHTLNGAWSPPGKANGRRGVKGRPDMDAAHAGQRWRGGRAPAVAAVSGASSSAVAALVAWALVCAEGLCQSRRCTCVSWLRSPNCCSAGTGFRPPRTPQGRATHAGQRRRGRRARAVAAVSSAERSHRRASPASPSRAGVRGSSMACGVVMDLERVEPW